MAITFPVAVPSLHDILSVRFIMQDAAGVSESPYTYSQETYEHPGKRWGIEVELVPMARDIDRAEEWAAFLASLRGRRGTFLLGDPAGQAARGALGGTPLVKGAGQSGGTIRIDGCAHNVQGWLKKGDWVQEGTGAAAHLHKSLTDVNTDNAGEATLELWPGPRAALTDNAALSIANTAGVWRLGSNTREYDIGGAQFFGFTFSAVEAL